MNEHEGEPVRGLPGELPEGERILWQGEPRWGSLARRAFHVRKVAVYFAILMAWRLGTAMSERLTALECAKALLPLAALACAALGVLALLAWGTSRTTVYTITTRRVVLRIGMALSVTINVPFSVVESAALRLYGDGTGDLPLALLGSGRVGYVPLWPHARPWRVARPEPMLRCIPEAQRVAELLSAALAAAAESPERGAGTPRSPGRTRADRVEARIAPEPWPQAVA